MDLRVCVAPSLHALEMKIKGMHEGVCKTEREAKIKGMEFEQRGIDTRTV